ncbi:hypothetical protein FOPG_18845 [Fusarium oxysporum f. sp. conglutinans race 2 54008]|nr:hypothetical protein FOPG_18845 [Fusarium oxysporum f. sp. conglutinans race 2 54008]
MTYNRVSHAGRLSTGLWINSQTQISHLTVGVTTKTVDTVVAALGAGPSVGIAPGSSKDNAERSLGVAIIRGSYDDHRIEPLTSGNDDLPWYLERESWSHDSTLLPGVENDINWDLYLEHPQTYDGYHDTVEFPAQLGSSANHEQVNSFTSLKPSVTVPTNSPPTSQEECNLPSEASDNSTIDPSVLSLQPQQSPPSPHLLPPNSKSPKSCSSANISRMTRTSQSTRPSPAPKTFQLCCDICGRLLDCVDSHWYVLL